MAAESHPIMILKLPFDIPDVCFGWWILKYLLGFIRNFGPIRFLLLLLAVMSSMMSSVMSLCQKSIFVSFLERNGSNFCSKCSKEGECGPYCPEPHQVKLF